MTLETGFYVARDFQLTKRGDRNALRSNRRLRDNRYKPVGNPNPRDTNNTPRNGWTSPSILLIEAV